MNFLPVFLLIWAIAAIAWVFHAASMDDWHKPGHPTGGMPLDDDEKTSPPV